MNDFELLHWYYALNGIAWNPGEKRAVFQNVEAAKAFKALAPDWTVLYRKEGADDE